MYARKESLLECKSEKIRILNNYWSCMATTKKVKRK